jgi:hypothetical protein
MLSWLTSSFLSACFSWVGVAEQEVSHSQPLEVIAFMVEKLHSHAKTMPSLDRLREHIRKSLAGHILRLKQNILTFFEGSSIKLSVVRLDDGQVAMKQAFAMCTHARLGCSVPLMQSLETATLQMILCLAYEHAKTSGVVRDSTRVQNFWAVGESEWAPCSSLVDVSESFIKHQLMSPTQLSFDLSNSTLQHRPQVTTDDLLLSLLERSNKVLPPPDGNVPPSAEARTFSSSGSQQIIVPSSILNSLQRPLPERHSSFFRDPSRGAPSLPDSIQQVMSSTDERMEKLNDDLQALAVSFQKEIDISNNTDAISAANMRQLLTIREQEAAALKAQLLLRSEQVTALEEALVQSMMTCAFAKPDVRTEIQERVVTLQQQVPTYIDKLSEITVPVYTEVEKIKEIPVETVIHVDRPYEVERTVEVKKDVVREVPIVQHRMVETPREVVTKEKIVTIDNNIPMPIELVVSWLQIGAFDRRGPLLTCSKFDLAEGSGD